jgi:hypothetical protein
VIGLLIHALAFILLIAYWIVGDQEIKAKLIVTGVYVVTWLLIFISPELMLGAQALFALGVGAFTFAGIR